MSAGLSTQRFVTRRIHFYSIRMTRDGHGDVGLRLAGVGLSGSLHGGFRTRDGGRLFLALVGGGPVVCFVLSDGTQVRVSPKDPPAVLHHLQRVVAAHACAASS